jgi:hypothetical protein
MNWKTILFVVLIGYGAFQHFQNRVIIHGAGEVAPDEPQQKILDNAAVQNIHGFDITPLATFKVKARVLSRARYYMGREADLSSVDFALGWGAMSDELVLNKINISQSNRFYFWRVNEFPIPQSEIETHSANMHIIPADSDVEDRLQSVRVGHVVQMEGYLIEAKAGDGWRWKSSLTRTDTGFGACELFLVKSLMVF